jgi:uncharacterized protein YkwD
MPRTLPLATACAALLLLVLAPNASAIGLGKQRVAAAPTKASGAGSHLIAPIAACPGQSNLDALAQAQQRAMLCMTEFARTQAGLPGFVPAPELESSASGKAGDILRCDDFSHFACGREFTYWMAQSSYLSVDCWRAGENLAWGSGKDGTVRSIFRAWMRSHGHRQNILGDFEQIGTSLQVGRLDGLSGTHVWTQHFGTQCDAPTG